MKIALHAGETDGHLRFLRALGLSHVVSAMPEILKVIPDLIYLIVGVTHPVVKLIEGEKYRFKLKKMIKEQEGNL